MTASSIAIRGASRCWGQRSALHEIDLNIEAGEHIALIGPSGSGKTTLLRLMMAALRPTSGCIEVGGLAIADMTPSQVRNYRRHCGLVDQGLQVLPRLSVHANVIAGRVAAWPWWKVVLSTLIPLERDEVGTLLADVGLADRQWDRADELSGGQQQRVSIARALAAAPSLLLGDEPTAALDPTTAAEVIDLLVRESRKRGATLIISTHRVSQIIDKVSRVIGLREGRVVLDCPPDDVNQEALNALYAGSNERA